MYELELSSIANRLSEFCLGLLPQKEPISLNEEQRKLLEQAVAYNQEAIDTAERLQNSNDLRFAKMNFDSIQQYKGKIQ